MEIKTKYKIGQDAYFFLNGEIGFGSIDKIEVIIDKNGAAVLYQLSSNYGTIEAFESYLFNNKQEALKERTKNEKRNY